MKCGPGIVAGGIDGVRESCYRSFQGTRLGECGSSEDSKLGERSSGREWKLRSDGGSVVVCGVVGLAMEEVGGGGRW